MFSFLFMIFSRSENKECEMVTLYLLSARKVGEVDFEHLRKLCVADVVVVDAFEEMALLPKEALPFIKRIIHVREKPRKSLFPCAYLDDDDCLSSIKKDVDEHGVKEPKFLSLSEELVPVALGLEVAFNQTDSTLLPAKLHKVFTDKVVMKKFMVENGIPAPTVNSLGIACDMSEKTLVSAAENLGLPMIVKPLSEAGSFQVHKINDLSDIKHCLETMKSIAPNLNFEAETFLSGALYHCDFMVAGGEVYYEACGRYLHPVMEARQGKPMGSVMVPADLPEYTDLMSVARKALACLKLQTAAVHMEFFRTRSHGVVFLELGMRPPGITAMSKLTSGNLFTLSVLQKVMGTAIAYNQLHAGSASAWAWIPAHKTGVISETITAISHPLIEECLVEGLKGECVSHGCAPTEAYRPLMRIKTREALYSDVMDALSYSLRKEHMKIS